MKTILITGSTHGIGEAAARALAAQGYQVILHGRNAERCQEVCQRIQLETGNPHIVFFTADFSNLAQVKSLAEQVKARYARLDVLVNNAGNFFLTHRLTPDGYESTWAVNHLSSFVLTMELLDLLKASAPARIVNVSSGSHQWQKLDCDLLTGKEKGIYLGPKAYGRSKLANVLFAYELSRRLEGQGVTANAMHPGLVRTHVWEKFGILSRLLMATYLRNALSSEEGAKTIVYLASSPEVEGVSGKYFYKCREVPSSPESHDLAAACRLWEAGCRLTSCPGMR